MSLDITLIISSIIICILEMKKLRVQRVIFSKVPQVRSGWLEFKSIICQDQFFYFTPRFILHKTFCLFLVCKNTTVQEKNEKIYQQCFNKMR